MSPALKLSSSLLFPVKSNRAWGEGHHAERERILVEPLKTYSNFGVHFTGMETEGLKRC